jgi:hypothetical protein
MTVMAFVPSEQFWLEQRVDQIDEESGGHECGERIVKNHDCISSQLLAGVDIRDRHGEEGDREHHHHDVHHWNAPNGILKKTRRCLMAERYFDLRQDSAKTPALLEAISALERIGIRDGNGGRLIGNP